MVAGGVFGGRPRRGCTAGSCAGCIMYACECVCMCMRQCVSPTSTHIYIYSVWI